MATTEQLTDEQLDRRVMSILRRELNVEEFARYLRMHRVGTGDYTKDRHQWLDHLKMEDILPHLTREKTQEKG
jgi:hypothetical protein